MVSTEAQIHALAPDAKSAKAAKLIADSDALSELRASPDGRWFAAEAQGSSSEPYRVLAELGDAARFGCSCGSYKYPCKHALALLFLLVRDRGQFRRDPSLGGAPLMTESLPLALPATGPTKPPSNEGEALVQAIFDEPEEIAHRLVYADWIADQGDADRAEFIRVQCEIERGAAGAKLAQLQKRETALLKKHRTTWMADVPKHLRGLVDFRGGFVAHLRLPMKSLVKYGQELFAHYPIWSVFLGTELDEKTPGKLAVEPFLARVRSLTLRSTVKVVEIFLSSVFLDHVRHLDLFATSLGSRGCQALAAWPGVKQLQSLSLASGEITDGALAALCAADLASLRALCLADNGITTAGAESLAACATTSNLRELNLSTNQIGPKGVKALAASPHRSSLRELDLSGNPITDQGAKALAESPSLASLTKLSLLRLDLGDAAKAALRQRFGDRVVFEV